VTLTQCQGHLEVKGPNQFLRTTHTRT